MNDLTMEVMRQTLELSDTVRAGLFYVQTCLEEGSLEEGFGMMEDVLDGMSSIRRAMPVILNNLPGQGLDDSLDRLREALEYMEESHALQKPERAWAVLKTVLMPAYDEWQEHMYRSLKRYTFC